MSQDKEFLLAAMLEPVDAGARFGKLPPHVTLMRWFQISEKDEAALNQHLADVAAKQQSLHIVGGDEAMFGHDQDIRVRKVGSQALAKLHERLLEVIDDFGATYKQYWVGKDYKPHVTYVDDVGLDKGEHANLPAMQLLWRLSPAGQRTIEAVYPLQGADSAQT